MFRWLFCFVMLTLVGCEGTIGVEGAAFTEATEGSVNGQSTVAGESGGSANAIVSGADLFMANCSSCHGAAAEGTATWPNSIGGYEPIASIVANGRGGMPAIGLTDAEVEKVQAHLLTLGEPATALDGEGLFQRYCASCHGPDAAGGAEWSGSLQGYEPIAPIVNNGRGNMAAVDITAEQVAEIQAWLLTLAPSLSSLSGPDVYDRVCATCHGDRGEGLAGLGPQLRYDDDGFSMYWARAGRVTTAYDSDMPAYASDVITDVQLAELFGYLSAAPKPTSGEGLYTQYCGNCHGVDGRGGPSGEELRGGDVDPDEEAVREGNGGSDYGSRMRYMSRWNTTQLTSAELRLIADYTDRL